jgi:hypothetical protein
MKSKKLLALLLVLLSLAPGLQAQNRKARPPPPPPPPPRGAPPQNQTK